jgi:hypothetical protein
MTLEPSVDVHWRPPSRFNILGISSLLSPGDDQSGIRYLSLSAGHGGTESATWAPQRSHR